MLSGASFNLYSSDYPATRVTPLFKPKFHRKLGKARAAKGRHHIVVNTIRIDCIFKNRFIAIV